MKMKRFELHPEPHPSRRLCKKAIDDAPDGFVVKIAELDRTGDQNDKFHAMLNDIAGQCQHLNLKLDRDTWKRLCIDQFKRDTLKEPECCAKYWARNQLSIMPSLDGAAIITLGEQSRRFPKTVATAFIEWLFAFGANHDVLWSDPTEIPIEAYERDRISAP